MLFYVTIEKEDALCGSSSLNEVVEYVVRELGFETILSQKTHHVNEADEWELILLLDSEQFWVNHYKEPAAEYPPKTIGGVLNDLGKFLRGVHKRQDGWGKDFVVEVFKLEKLSVKLLENMINNR